MNTAPNSSPVHLHRATRWVPLLALCATAAQAGRPLATDDAATAEPGSCQVEVWQDRSHEARQRVVAPACGLVAGVELGAELSRLRLPGDAQGAGAVSVKWMPSQARLDTPAGELAWGLKVAADFERKSGPGLRQSGASALAVATLRLAPELALHANAGFAQARAPAPSGGSAWVGRVAAAWTPAADWLAFAESLGNGRTAAFGGTVRSAGVRHWVVPDRLGLDLTLARERGGPRVLGAGLGWYGIGL